MLISNIIPRMQRLAKLIAVFVTGIASSSAATEKDFPVTEMEQASTQSNSGDNAVDPVKNDGLGNEADFLDLEDLVDRHVWDEDDNPMMKVTRVIIVTKMMIFSCIGAFHGLIYVGGFTQRFGQLEL